MLHKPLTVDGLGDHGGGSAALVLPGRRQDSSQLVVPELIENNIPSSHVHLNQFFLV